MVHTCVVRGCKSQWSPGSAIKFHVFPKDTQRRKDWLALVPLKTAFYNNAKICSLHFKWDDYDHSGRKLKQMAKPFFNENIEEVMETEECIPSVLTVQSLPYTINDPLPYDEKLIPLCDDIVSPMIEPAMPSTSSANILLPIQCQLSSECVLCTECLTLLKNGANTISDGSFSLPALGHRSICFPCGNSILRATRTYPVRQDRQERNILVRNVPLHSVSRLGRVCAACWRSATREVQRNLHNFNRPGLPEALPDTGSHGDLNIPVPRPVQQQNLHPAQLPNDMENYMQYSLMGSVGKIRMRPNCLPSKFECQPDRRKRTAPPQPRSAVSKRQRKDIIEEILKEAQMPAASGLSLTQSKTQSLPSNSKRKDSSKLHGRGGSPKFVEYNVSEEDLVPVVLQAINPLAEKSKSAAAKESNSLNDSSSTDSVDSTEYEENGQARLDDMTEEIAHEMSEPQYMDTDYIEDYFEVVEEKYEPHDIEQNNIDQLSTEDVSRNPVKQPLDIPTSSNDENIRKETQTAKEYLDILLNVQKFNSTAWSEFKYVDTQKLYIHSPGFEELKANEEVQSYDNLDFLAQTDRSYAALTFCILKQQEALHECMKNLLSLAQSNEVNQDNFNDKIEEVLQESEYEKISCDLLELVCGYRSEVIGKRRDAIINQVQDPVFKEKLKIINPSYTHIFDPELFTVALQQAGGVKQVLLPAKDIIEATTCKIEPQENTMFVESQTTQDIDQKPVLTIDMNTFHKFPSIDESHHQSFSNNDPPSQVGKQCVEQHSNVETPQIIKNLPSNYINRSLPKRVQKATRGKNIGPPNILRRAPNILRGPRKKQSTSGLSDNREPVLLDGNRIPVDPIEINSDSVEQTTDAPVKTIYVVKRKRLQLQLSDDSEQYLIDKNISTETATRNNSKSRTRRN